ncbi:MAG: hypothetical protein KCHDKBKB_02680 [Elusimicrobia bacterium]|nr:hypothetical protein [Elusimicrobiota bacterium]
MSTETTQRTYHIRNSEKCFRFKPEAFCSHAPANRGIYELVTFDNQQNAKVLYVGAAFEKGILECLEAHAAGRLAPSSTELLAHYPNLYFDYLVETDARTIEDAQDVYWWLVQKHRPPYNDLNVQNSGRFQEINVVEEE